MKNFLQISMQDYPVLSVMELDWNIPILPRLLILKRKVAERTVAAVMA
jgi:hypothetical protein